MKSVRSLEKPVTFPRDSRGTARLSRGHSEPMNRIDRRLANGGIGG